MKTTVKATCRTTAAAGSFNALLLFARFFVFGVVVVRSWLVCNTVNSLPEDADSSGTESDGDKEEGDSDDEEDDAEILEDDEGEG